MKKHLKTNDKKLKLTTLGFTLIELLAVIVVLAIIALIATPLVLNTIEDARKGSAKSSGYTYISEVETSLAKYMLKNVETNYTPGPYDVATLTNDLNISLKGDTPSEGNICIGSNGTVTSASLKINGYVVNYDGKEAMATKSDNLQSINCEGEIVLTGPRVFDKAASLVYDDTGVCKTDDTTYEYMGGCYIKGTSNNNYVWYNGFMWRIMGINSDNTVRLITDENVTTLPYGASGTALTYTTNEDYIHDWLNDYFYSHLNSTKNIIQEGTYFCSETTNSTSLTEGRTTCTEGYEVTTKIGLLTYDEYLLSDTSSSYLNIGQNFWTMTPYSTSNAWYVVYGGNGSNNYVTYANGVRPVINVSSDAIITAGDGTSQNFFVLGEDKSTDVTGKLSEKVTSGEYVSLEGKIYRVVNKETDGVRIILDNFYETDLAYESQDGFIIEKGKIGAKINSDVLEWLEVDESQIVSTTYYQGYHKEGFTYSNALVGGGYTVEDVRVGLIRLGDILSGQSSTMLTNNYTDQYDYNNIKSYWTMNIYQVATNNRCWIISNNGQATGYYDGYTSGIRPVIVVRNDLEITSGNGTWNNPYQIA